MQVHTSTTSIIGMVLIVLTMVMCFLSTSDGFAQTPAECNALTSASFVNTAPLLSSTILSVSNAVVRPDPKWSGLSYETRVLTVKWPEDSPFVDGTKVIEEIMVSKGNDPTFGYRVDPVGIETNVKPEFARSISSYNDVFDIKARYASGYGYDWNKVKYTPPDLMTNPGLVRSILYVDGLVAYVHAKYIKPLAIVQAQDAFPPVDEPPIVHNTLKGRGIPYKIYSQSVWEPETYSIRDPLMTNDVVAFYVTQRYFGYGRCEPGGKHEMENFTVPPRYLKYDGTTGLSMTRNHGEATLLRFVKDQQLSDNANLLYKDHRIIREVKHVWRLHSPSNPRVRLCWDTSKAAFVMTDEEGGGRLHDTWTFSLHGDSYGLQNYKPLMRDLDMNAYVRSIRSTTLPGKGWEVLAKTNNRWGGANDLGCLVRTAKTGFLEREKYGDAFFYSDSHLKRDQFDPEVMKLIGVTEYKISLGEVSNKMFCFRNYVDK